MNREARRKKVEPEKTITITCSKLERMILADVERRMEPIRKELFNRMIYLQCYILHNTFDFGEIRLKRYLANLEFQLGCLETGDLTVNDMRDWLKDKYDIDFAVKDN